MNPSNCFLEIPADTSKLFQICVEAVQNADPVEWQQRIGFNHLILPLDQVLEACPILADIHSRIEIFCAGIFRLRPLEYYHLHTDTVRGASINMMIEHHHSNCVFVNLEARKCTMPMLELCYDPGVMYLFNSQMPHTVLNFTGNRYMFSIQFQEPKQVLKYADVVRHLISIQKKIQS